MLDFLCQFQSGVTYKKSMHDIQNAGKQIISFFYQIINTIISNRSVCSWYGSQSIPQTCQCKPSNEA